MPREILDILLRASNENQRISYLRLQKLLDILSSPPGQSGVNKKEKTAVIKKINKLQAGIFSGNPLTQEITDEIEKEVLRLAEPINRLRQ
jgi:hypothetical protein